MDRYGWNINIKSSNTYNKVLRMKAQNCLKKRNEKTKTKQNKKTQDPKSRKNRKRSETRGGVCVGGGGGGG